MTTGRRGRGSAGRRHRIGERVVAGALVFIVLVGLVLIVEGIWFSDVR